MKYNEFVARCQALAKIGKKFSKDPYALENYQELEDLSKEMMNQLTGDARISIYERDIYPTPNSSVRVIVFKDDKLLMVKEIQDGGWSVPGGWCDVFESLKEAAVKEVNQETGYQIKIGRLLAIFQRERYKDYPTIISEQVHYFVGEIIGGSKLINHEVSDIEFVDLNEEIELSRKISRQELSIALEVYRKNKEVYVD